MRPEDVAARAPSRCFWQCAEAGLVRAEDLRQAAEHGLIRPSAFRRLHPLCPVTWDEYVSEVDPLWPTPDCPPHLRDAFIAGRPVSVLNSPAVVWRRFSWAIERHVLAVLRFFS